MNLRAADMTDYFNCLTVDAIGLPCVSRQTKVLLSPSEEPKLFIVLLFRAFTIYFGMQFQA